MRKAFFGFLFAFVFLFLAMPVRANEGVVRLSGKETTDGRCFLASVYIDGTYRILMTCRDLKVAQDPVKNHYVAWVDINGRKFRVGEIIAGKLQATVQDKFDYVFVTLEGDGYPNKPAENMVLSGRMEAIDFGKGVTDTSFVPATITASPTAANKNQTSPATQPAGNKLVSFAAGIGKAIFLGFVLLLIVVGVMGFMARRKSL